MKEFRVDSTVAKRLLGFCGELTSIYLEDPLSVRQLDYSELSDALSQHRNLMERPLIRSGESRKNEWELGWKENFELLQLGGLESLIPKYFGKFEYVRLSGKFYGANLDTELRFLRVILLNELERLHKIFDIEAILEFGCGTGHHLFFLQSFFDDLKFLGTDWSKCSSEIIQLACKKFGIKKIEALDVFDYFNPNPNFQIGLHTGVITVASLEQVGSNFTNFLDYLIASKPAFALHIEPEEELLNPKNVFDQSSIEYIRKRGYLNGFMSELKRKEDLGELKILRATRSNLGSFPMDGYSIFVWVPLNNE